MTGSQMAPLLASIGDAFFLLFSGSQDVWRVVILSLSVSGSAIVIATVVGVPLGYMLGMSRFAGRGVLMLLVNTAMGFPPVVMGLVVYLMLAPPSPLEGLHLLYTPAAMSFAQTILALPLVVGVTAAAIASVPRDLRLQIRALGATRTQEGAAVLRESRKGVMASIIAGFGAIVSEVGAVSIVGGDIVGTSRVMTTAIMAAVRTGETGLAVSWAMILVGLALMVNASMTVLQDKGVQYER
jgi:tungstate transport system permease protein